MVHLKLWLQKCGYPKAIVKKAFHNAKLQGPALQKSIISNTIPFISTHASNIDTQSTLTIFKSLLSTVKSEHLQAVFKDTRIVLGLRQPKSILRLVSNANFSHRTQSSATPGIQIGKCRSDCNLCNLGYIQPCTSFKVANGST